MLANRRRVSDGPTPNAPIVLGVLNTSTVCGFDGFTLEAEVKVV
jgi:hypothetical protein